MTSGRVQRFARILFAVSFVVACIVACGGDEQSAVDRAKLAAKCFIDSDCEDKLRCAFQKCHVECEESKDCEPTYGADARCVISNRPFNVCQLPEDRSCSYNSDCPVGQRCASDRSCRDECKSDIDCVRGQVCTTGVCAEPKELVDGGLPVPDGGALPNSGQQCTYNSDCVLPLTCRGGVCSFQCKSARDCARNENCVNNICEPPPPEGGACVPKTCADFGKNCGVITDGCGGIVKCGAATTATSDCSKAGETCGGGGQANLCGPGQCLPKTCEQLGKNCGLVSDGCSGLLNCGSTCPSGFSCGATGTDNVCGCKADNAAACAGKACGTALNNCGQSVSCGTCTGAQTCGALAPNQCGCKAKSCADLGIECGTAPDGCGGQATCVSCGAGKTCGGGGTPNVCGVGGCVPKDCAALGKNCGTVSNGCDGTLNCGATCPAGETCGGAGVANVCACAKKTCLGLGKDCGSVSDGCGGTLSCGSCNSPTTCGGAGVANVCGCAKSTCSPGTCGLIPDNCGGQVDCGGCAAGQVCGGGGPSKCGVPSVGTSCKNVPAVVSKTCGPTRNDDCCASDAIPGDPAFNMRLTTKPVKVSPYRLDRYEVTIMRFREFVNAGKGLRNSAPAAGAGAHPFIAGSGWDPSWDQLLPADAAAMNQGLSCNAQSLWSANPGPYENYPISCMNWVSAFAFCAWDGGRLPTEAEWLFAAAGGTEYRYYPWQATSAGGVPCDRDNNNFCGLNSTLQYAGAAPLGDGRWGTRNLAGNMYEFALDYYTSDHRNLSASANDWADLQALGSRVIIGGAWNATYAYNTGNLGSRSSVNTTGRSSVHGVRCARN
jgi:formylglycine-generating enzyme required for sulfatase activity